MSGGRGDAAREGGVAWRPSLGAWPEGTGVRFRVWAPERREVVLLLEGASSGTVLERQEDGTFAGLVDGAGPGTRYRYRLDGLGPYPDPASRFQPDGVHGPSEVVDPVALPLERRRMAGRAARGARRLRAACRHVHARGNVRGRAAAGCRTCASSA